MTSRIIVASLALFISTSVGRPQERHPETIILVRCKSSHQFAQPVSEIIGVDPATGKVTILNGEPGRDMPGDSVAVSPDGRFMAVKQWKAAGNVDSFYVHVKSIGDPKVGTRNLTLYGTPMCWSPDGRYFVVAEDEEWKKTCYRVDASTLKAEAIALPAVPKPNDPKGCWGHVVLDWSPDGKWYLTKIISGDAAETPTGLFRVRCDTLQVKKIEGAPGARHAKFSPDGSRVLYEAEVEGWRRLFVIDSAGGKPQALLPADSGELIEGSFCWSPDGKRIAFVDRISGTDEKSGITMRLVVIDAGGKNPVVLVKSQDPIGDYLCLPNWRRIAH
jgi:Tol biopolymer transport system component